MRIYFTTLTLLLFVLCGSVFAQTTGDFRSNGTGNWGDNTKWEMYDGTSWGSAGTAPTGSGTITLRSMDSLYMNVAVTITGTLVSDSGRLGNSATTLTFANGSMFVLPFSGGIVPLAIWGTGSTCKITGYITGSKPVNCAQDFYNFTWECPSQNSNIDLAMTGNTIHGDVTIVNTGTTRMQLTSPASYIAPITIEGNIYVQAGQFASNGSSSAASMEFHSLGDIIVTGGNFSMSRGSGPDVLWYLTGDFSVSNATLQNSGGLSRTQQLVFAGTTQQNITLTNVAYGSGTAPFTMRVQSGAILNLGQEVISSSNSGSFIVDAGGTIMTAQPGGFEGNIQCTAGSNGGGNRFSTAANYVFNGSSAQSTGTLMPDTVNSLTINNASGVTLSRTIVINDTLHLVAGEFNNTIPFILGANGVVTYEGGSLTVPLAVGPDGTVLPEVFALHQNYPNPFNPTTNIKYQISEAGLVTLKVFNVLGVEVATLVNDNKFPGEYSIKWNATSLPSGVYLYKVTSGTQTLTQKMILTK